MIFKTDTNSFRTPWFPGEVFPEYPGLYERQGPFMISMDFWTGTHWMYQCINNSSVFSDYPDTMFEKSEGSYLPWRGTFPF